jgi:hypothetical protein
MPSKSSHDYFIDLRKEKRTRLLFDPLLLDKDGRVIARVVDLSTAGAMLYTRRGAYSQGAIIKGWLQAPPVDGEDEFFLAVTYQVRWVSDENESGWSQMGCLMKPLDDATAERLDHLISLTAP